jgi:MFS transporter, ACDE family, multidrug resistance protein
MAPRYLPLPLRHPGAPDLRDFAILAGLDAAVRGTLISVMPLQAYDAVGSAGEVSLLYLAAGVTGLIWGLLVPALTRLVPRRWVYSGGCLLYLGGMALAIDGSAMAIALALKLNAMATVTLFVCLNAYVLDHVERADLARGQSLQMLFAAAPWTIGPILGVWLRGWWQPAPFLLAGAFALTLLAAFWWLRLGNGRQIGPARRRALNPVAYLGPFLRQPRLVAGWLFAVIRSSGWWVFVVYLPIFAIEAGLGDRIGGIALSASNALWFVAPLIARTARRLTIRRTLRLAFALGVLTFGGAGLLAGWPWVVVGMLILSSIALGTLDAIGGLPFMMAVKPSQRTEMAAVYASFRDVSGIVTPGAAWLILLVAPLPAIFVAAGLAMAGGWVMAGRLHPRLGIDRPSAGGQTAPLRTSQAAASRSD